MIELSQVLENACAALEDWKKDRKVSKKETSHISSAVLSLRKLNAIITEEDKLRKLAHKKQKTQETAERRRGSYMKNICKNLEFLMENKEVDEVELIELTGLPPCLIPLGKYSKKNDIELSVICKISSALGVSVKTLVFSENE